MNWFLSTAQPATYAAAIMLIGYSPTLVLVPALGQEKKAPDQQVVDASFFAPVRSPEDLLKAAAMGDASAQFELGEMYRRGADVPKDDAQAVRWYRKAAEQGDAKAQANLGFMYDRGRGVPQDFAQAARWYRKAAEQGYWYAQLNLGILSEHGQGVPQDYAEAIGWYRKAAEQGNAHAQRNLGSIYETGDGVPQDYAEAIRWYREAADKGDADAQLILGVRYEHGQEVPQDYAEAARWYLKAAEQGNTDAQFHLGRMHTYGYGAPKDYVQAHMWMNLAASRATGGDQSEYAHERDLLAARMSGRQVMEAQRLAREWKPNSGSDSGAGKMNGSRWEARKIVWWCLLLGVVGIAGVVLFRWKRARSFTLRASMIGHNGERQWDVHNFHERLARLWTWRRVPRGSSSKDMNSDIAKTLLARARTSFAEVREAFPGSSATVIEIDQEPPGEDRVRATFFPDPAHPALRVERFPKPNLAPLLVEDRQAHLPLLREFDAFWDGTRFGWLEHPCLRGPGSSTDIIEMVRGLL
jgi:hypothetical protein